MSCSDVAPQDGAAGSGPDDVVVTAEALGSWTSLYKAAADARTLSLTTKYAIFAYGDPDEDACQTDAARVDVVLTNLGTRLDTPPLPGGDCGTSVTGAVGDDNGVFIADYQSDSIYKLVAVPNLKWGWQKIASTTGSAYGSRMVTSSTHLYWHDSDGLQRVANSGGAVTTLAARGNMPLGFEGSYLYAQKSGDPNQGSWPLTLQRLPLSGQTPTTLHVSYTYGFSSGFNFDASFFYFIDRDGSLPGTHRLIRLTKSGSTLTVLREMASTDAYPLDFTLNSTHYYWTQDEFEDGYRLYRQKISDGSISSIGCTAECGAVVVSSSNVYVIGLDTDDRIRLYRSAL